MLAPLFDFKGAENIRGALEKSGGSWTLYVILMMIWLWFLSFYRPTIQNFEFLIDFQGEKIINPDHWL